MSPDFGPAIISLIESVAEPVTDILPSPLDWIVAGIFGFAKGLIARILD